MLLILIKDYDENYIVILKLFYLVMENWNFINY